MQSIRKQNNLQFQYLQILIHLQSREWHVVGQLRDVFATFSQLVTPKLADSLLFTRFDWGFVCGGQMKIHMVDAVSIAIYGLTPKLPSCE